MLIVGKISKKSCITKAYLLFPRPAIATKIYSLLEVIINRFDDQIAYIYGLEEHQ